MHRHSLPIETCTFKNTNLKYRNSTNFVINSLDFDKYIKTAHHKLCAIENACKIAKQCVFSADLAVKQQLLLK